jgi:hypothetical protein
MGIGRSRFVVGDVDERGLGLLPLEARVRDTDGGGHALAGTVTLWVRFPRSRSDDRDIDFLREVRGAVAGMLSEENRWLIRAVVE